MATADPVLLSDDMLRRALSDQLLIQRLPILKSFTEEGMRERNERLGKKCPPCQRKRKLGGRTVADLNQLRRSLSSLGPTQQKTLREFFGVSQLMIEYRRPGQTTGRRVIYR